MQRVFVITDVPVKKSRPSRHGYGVSPSEEYTAEWRLGILDGISLARAGSETWTVQITLEDSPTTRVIHERNIFKSQGQAEVRMFYLRLKGLH